MIPPAITLAKKTPGLYLCKSSGILFIRVDALHQVHQIDPRTMLVDGLLDDEGWSDSSRTQNMAVYRLEELT